MLSLGSNLGAKIGGVWPGGRLALLVEWGGMKLATKWNWQPRSTASVASGFYRKAGIIGRMTADRTAFRRRQRVRLFLQLEEPNAYSFLRRLSSRDADCSWVECYRGLMMQVE